MITTRIAGKKEFSKIQSLLENYLQYSRNDNVQTVGRRLLNEFKLGMEMTVFLAEKDNSILAISNGVIGEHYGFSYHTLALVSEQGFGSSLFRKKVDFLLNEKKKVIAKPESKVGLRMTLNYGFTREQSLDHLLYWKGDSYILHQKKS